MRDPATQLRYAVADEHEVEPTKDGPVVRDEHVAGPVASLLICQQGVVPLGELLEELVATVGDRSSEVGAIRDLEIQDGSATVSGISPPAGRDVAAPG